jgi:hypothetical protein
MYIYSYFMLSYNIVKWPVYRSVEVQSVVLPSWVHTWGPVPAVVNRSISLSGTTVEQICALCWVFLLHITTFCSARQCNRSHHGRI